MSNVAYLTKLLDDGRRMNERLDYEYFATSIGWSARLKAGEASVGDAVLHIGGEDWVRIEDDEQQMSEMWIS